MCRASQERAGTIDAAHSLDVQNGSLRDEVERLSQRVDVLTEEKNQLLREAERAAEIKALFAGVSEKTREVQAAAASVIGQAEGRPRKGSAVGTPRERAVLCRATPPRAAGDERATGRGSRVGGGGGVGGVASRLRDAAAGKVGVRVYARDVWCNSPWLYVVRLAPLCSVDIGNEPGKDEGGATA